LASAGGSTVQWCHDYPSARHLIDPRPAAPPDGGRGRWRHLLGILGPGLITGAADDDPSGIATYWSVDGASAEQIARQASRCARY